MKQKRKKIKMILLVAVFIDHQSGPCITGNGGGYNYTMDGGNFGGVFLSDESYTNNVSVAGKANSCAGDQP